MSQANMPRYFPAYGIEGLGMVMASFDERVTLQPPSPLSLLPPTTVDDILMLGK